MRKSIIVCALALLACEKDPSSAPAANPASASAAPSTPASMAPAASAPPASAPTASAPMPGGDRDAHGCIGSAGYRWCARENACVRMWELAKQKGFPNDLSAFEAYCR